MMLAIILLFLKERYTCIIEDIARGSVNQIAYSQ